MAKTQFVDKDPGIGQEGTVVTAAFLNSLFYTSGGHVHDGGTEDGSAAKVDLEDHVTGQLPSDKVMDTGRKMIFFEASAPTGWTQETTSGYHGSALRLATTSGGGGSGGTHDLSSPPSTSHTHTTGNHALSIPELPPHGHTYNEVYYLGSGGSINAGNEYHTQVGASGSSGSGSPHNHGATGSGGPTAFAPLYVDVIIAEKD